MLAKELVRDRRLDTLRGLFLVVMLVDHLGGYIADFTYQPFGFVSAAEGFIFLSGLMFGQVYGRYISEPDKIKRASFRRALLIYKYHITMVLFVAALAVTPFFGELWYWALRPHQEAPLATTLAMLGLVHQPGYLDILPMYLIFILLSPSILLALHRGQHLLVVSASVMLWLVGQQDNLIDHLYEWASISYHPGYFNLLSWQILWTAGLLIGYARLTGIPAGFAAQRSLLWLVTALAVVLWVWRRQYLEPAGWSIPLLDKPNLGPLRLLNCMLLMLIGWRVMQWFKTTSCLPFFELLGRYSIQVFAFHSVMLYLLQYSTQLVRKSGEINFTLYTLALVFCLLIPVVVTRRWRGLQNRWSDLSA